MEPAIALTLFFAALLATTWKFRNPCNPVLLVVVWWLVWGMVAWFGPYGLEPLGNEIQWAVGAMLCSFLAGSLMAQNGKPPRQDFYLPFNKATRPLVFLVSQFGVVALILIYYIFQRGAYLGDMMDGTGRMEVIDSVAVSGIRFSNLVMEYVVAPTVLFAILFGVNRSRQTRSIGGLLLAGVFASLWSFAFFNRALLYLSLVLTSVWLMESLVQPGKRWSLFKYAGLAALIAVLGITLIQWIGSLRTKERSLSPEKAWITAIYYHVGGFFMLQQELENPTSLANTKITFGRSVLGGVDALFFITLGRYSGVLPQNLENFSYRQQYAIIGSTAKEEIQMNAFYTVLHSCYLDARWAGVVLFPFIFGVLVGISYLRATAQNSEYYYLLTTAFLFVGFAGLFISPTEEPRLWICIGEIILLGHWAADAGRTRKSPSK